MRLAALQRSGFCVLPGRFSQHAMEACRAAFWPLLEDYLAGHSGAPNRGPHRHFLPMPFSPPCFAPEFFFDSEVLGILRGAMDDRIVADQFGCDVALPGSEYQQPHADYQRPLFAESPDLSLPAYMLAVSFALVPITPANGPIEIAPSTHRMPRAEAHRSVESGNIAMQPVTLEPGDVLIRHPWALHRGTPNRGTAPRPLVTIRYVRRWYADASREVQAIPRALWESLDPEYRALLRFPVGT